VTVRIHSVVLLARLLRRIDVHHGRLQVVQLVQQAVVDLAGHRVAPSHRPVGDREVAVCWARIALILLSIEKESGCRCAPVAALPV
jgi:hypothetical protein